jgi:hypothetical protein
MLTHLRKDYRIVGSLINCFYNRLFIATDNEQIIAKTMLSRLNKPNKLERLVQRKKFDSTNNFVAISACDLDFPQLTLENLESHITLGIYQIEQCQAYINEHINKNGDFQLLINEKEIKEGANRLLYCKFFSRHKSQTIYNVYIEYNPLDKTINSISEWYCNCKIGARTVGCCSHIAALLYYLGIERNKSKAKKDKAQSSIIINSKEVSQITSKTLVK